MKWYYKSRVRRLVIRISIIAVLFCVVLPASMVFIFSERNAVGTSSHKESYSGNIKETPSNVPVHTVSNAPATPTTTPTTTAYTPAAETSIAPAATNTLLITPTVMPTITPTSTPRPTPTTTPSPVKTTPPPRPSKKPNSPTPTSTKFNSINSIIVQYKNADSSSSVNVICPILKITNKGKSSVKFSDIVIRYYYTKEGDGGETFWCNEFSKDSSQVHGSFFKLKTPKLKADHYLRIGFYDKAGSLKPGESAEVKIGFSKNEWSPYNQFNDYSYNKANKRFINWDHITLYVSGKLVYGKEP